MSIHFYSTKDNFGEFSNFAAYGLVHSGAYWRTSEHYFQAQKFLESKIQDMIRNAETPGEAAKIGRDPNNALRKDWELVKDEIMKTAVMQKFLTHPELKELLISTGDEYIVENASGDYYWGCGNDGTGKNMLGRILMDVRAALR